MPGRHSGQPPNSTPDRRKRALLRQYAMDRQGLFSVNYFCRFGATILAGSVRHQSAAGTPPSRPSRGYRGADRPKSGCASPGRVRTEKHDPAGINGPPDTGARLSLRGRQGEAAAGVYSTPLRNGPMTGGSVPGRSRRRATAGSGQQRTGSTAGRPEDPTHVATPSLFDGVGRGRGRGGEVSIMGPARGPARPRFAAPRALPC